MKHSFFDNKFKPDVPFGGNPGAPNITTGVLSITAEPEFGARRQTYHFWVTDSSCLDESINHFRDNGFPDHSYTKYSSRDQWKRSYPDAVLRKDTLPQHATPPHISGRAYHSYSSPSPQIHPSTIPCSVSKTIICPCDQ